MSVVKARPYLLLFIGLLIYAAAVYPFRVALPIPDDSSFYHGSLFTARGEPRVTIKYLLYLHSLPQPAVATADTPGAPFQFVPTIDGKATSEKPPGYIWWLTLCRLGHVPRLANTLLLFILLPVTYFFVRRMAGSEVAGWAVTLFLLTPFTLIFFYRAFMPTFAEAAFVFAALAASCYALERRRYVYSFFAGALWAAAALIRPTHAFYIAVIAVAGFYYKRGPVAVRLRYLGIFLTASVFAAAGWGYYNWLNFGSPVKTGYYARFVAFDPNAVKDLWREKPRYVAPAAFWTASTPFANAEPRPDVRVIRCVAKRVWQTHDALWVKFRLPTRGKVRLSTVVAVGGPLGEERPPDGFVAVAVASGKNVLACEEVRSSAGWGEVSLPLVYGGEELTVAAVARSGDGGPAWIFLAPVEVATDEGKFIISNYPIKYYSLRQVFARNLIGVYPYIFLAIPILILAFLGISRARRKLPGHYFYLNVAVVAITLAIYLQNKVYTSNVVRYYAPVVGPAALFASFAVAGAAPKSRLACVLLLGLHTVTSFVLALADFGVLNIPALPALIRYSFYTR